MRLPPNCLRFYKIVISWFYLLTFTSDNLLSWCKKVSNKSYLLVFSAGASARRVSQLATPKK